MQNQSQSRAQVRDEVKQYDTIVIGSGQCGGPVATALSDAGQRVALVERAHVGGSCVNVGCTPTKTMLASARVAYLARRSADYGVYAGDVRVEMKDVRARKRQIVENSRSGSLRSTEEAENVDLICGEAAFADPIASTSHFPVGVRLNDGGNCILTAGQVIINSGARPRIPELQGLADVPYLDNATIMELDHLPEHLLIVGGGYIALEFGQMFRRFGSQVTIIQRSEQLLVREDVDIADEVATILRDDGIEVLLATDARAVTQNSDGAIELQVRDSTGTRTLTGTHLLIATGREPNSDVLQLNKVGIKTNERGHIQVNDRLQTNVPGIYAVGDVNGGPAFTHISYDDFRILRTNLIEGGDATTRGRIVSYTVYMDPELGRVGLSEQEAKAQGYRVGVAKLPMKQVARAIEMDETRGLMKAVVDLDTKQILGCAILGVHGGEIAAILQVAMMGQLAYPTIQNAVFAHPTLAESLNSLFTSLDDE